MVTWSGGDRIPLTTDPELLLNAFEDFLDGLPALTDSTMLIT